MIKIAPSILACDFANLQSEAEAVRAAGADMLHVDVMDGHFVPNISLGVPVVASLKKATTLPLDVHLMISDPLRYAEEFIKAGSDILTFHYEADSDVAATIATIKALGAKAGLSIKPKTSAKEILPYLKDLDMLLVMTVEPGFGGQSFMAEVCPKITQIREYADQKGLSLDIQVDGGISAKTAPMACRAGANILVAGSSVFGAKDYTEAIAAIRAACIEG